MLTAWSALPMLDRLFDDVMMTARLPDGVLAIRGPEKPQPRPRRIAIDGASGPTQLGEKKQ